MLAVAMAAVTAGSITAESASINASVRIVPLEVVLDLSTTAARVGDAVRVRATVTNIGSTRVSNTSVEIRLDTSALRTRGALVTSIARLQPGRATTISWQLCALREGNYVILARASNGGASVESEARLLTIAGDGRRRCA